jgi:hypothetical protein
MTERATLGVWNMVVLTLMGAFNLGILTCSQFAGPEPDLWDFRLGSAILFVFHAGTVTGGLYGLRARIRRLERGPADSAARN